MTSTPSEGGRKEQVEDAWEDDIPARLEMSARLKNDRAVPQPEEPAGRSEGARESEDRTSAAPSETPATNDASESEHVGSREERLRREKSSHKTGGHMTLGSFLERLSRAKDTSDSDEQVIVQGLQRELEPEETSVASRFAAKPEMSQSVRAVAQPEPEPVRERYRVVEEAMPESKRTAVVRSYEMSARSETPASQQRAYDRYEPEPELESEPKPEARLGSESDKTTVIDKSSRPTLPRSVPQTYVADTQTPTTVEETPDPGYDSESDTSNESVRVAQQTSTERGAEANESASREEIGQQSKKNRQPAAKHARHGAAGAKGSGSGGLFSRFKPATKTSTPKAAGRDGQTGTPSLTPAKKSDLPKRKRMLILAIATTIVAAAVAGVVYLITNATPGGSAASAPAQQMLTAMVYRGDFVDAINAEGTVEPLVVMDVTGEVDGVVENLVIGQGSFVTAGDTLFKIRNDALENAVSEANARLSEAERTVNDTDLAYRQSQADYQNAWNIAAMSNNWSTFDQTGLTNAINAAAARRSEAIAARDAANSALVMAQAAVDRCNVRAPITGIVTELNVADGVSVGAGTPDLAGGTTGPLLKVGDITQMKVTTLVAEAYVPFVRPGQVATISFPALPGITQTASVNAVSSMPSGVAADASGSASYAVEFLLAAPDPNLKPGMSASLNIVLQSASDSLIVPSKAIWQEIDENGVTHYFVNVVTDSGELKKCEVSIVAQNNDEAAVWGEVGEGDIVRVNS